MPIIAIITCIPYVIRIGFECRALAVLTAVLTVIVVVVVTLIVVAGGSGMGGSSSESNGSSGKGGFMLVHRSLWRSHNNCLWRLELAHSSLCL